MISIVLLVLLFFVFFLNSKKKRVSPNSAEKYIISPIDGYVSNIQTVNIDDLLFVELTIHFFWHSDRNLFSPLKGNVHIKENTCEKLSLFITNNSLIAKGLMESNFGLQSNKNYIEISHFSDPFLSKLNFFSPSFMSFYEKEYWPSSSLNYGFMLYGSHVKILFHATNTLVVAKEQTLIGGESILAIFEKDAG